MKNSLSNLVILFVLIIVTVDLWLELDARSLRRGYQIKIARKSSKKSESQSNTVYMMVFDAGSSGTRLMISAFRKSSDPDRYPHMDLVHSEFAETKPGLSSYVGDESAHKLAMDSIKKLISSTNFSKTTGEIYVQATAGLRLVAIKNEMGVNNLLSYIYNEMNSLYGDKYIVKRESIAVLPDYSEGDFAWISLDFLNNLPDGDHKNFNGISDLGGASTQITIDLKRIFVKNIRRHPLFKAPDNFYRSFKSLGVKRFLYSHSYLFKGVDYARSLTLKVDPNCQENDCTSDSDTTYESVCLHPEFKSTQKTGSGFIKIKGKEIGESNNRFEMCLEETELALNDILPISDHHSVLFRDSERTGMLALISSFYYVSSGMKAIPKEGGPISLGSLARKTMEECENVQLSGRFEPYYCMDSVYQVSLLRLAYQLTELDILHPIQKLNGHEVSWSLGLAINYAYNALYN